MVGAMHEASFFQKQIERCNLLAEQASSKTEQEFWLRSAARWEAILQLKTTKTRLTISALSSAAAEVASALRTELSNEANEPPAL